MNRKIFLSTAAIIAAAVVQPVEAKDKRGEGRGDGGGGGAKHQAPAKAKQAPNVAARSQGRSFRAPAPRVQTPSRVGRSPAIVQSGRSRVQDRGRSHVQDRRAPSIAFGGSSARSVDRRTTVQNINRYNNRTVVRNDRYYRPPSTIYRNWDRRHVHVWNNNRYRWYNNDWVILGGGYAPYYYDSTPYYNNYSYGSYTPAVVAEFAPTSNLASEVQEELGRRGYDTGGVDGVIGSQTRNAIAAFQADNGLAVTGRIDQSLLRELGI